MTVEKKYLRRQYFFFFGGGGEEELRILIKYDVLKEFSSTAYYYFKIYNIFNVTQSQPSTGG